MKNLIIIFFLLISLISCSQHYNTYYYALPYGEVEATDVTANSFRLRASYTPNGCKLTNVTLYYGTDNPPTQNGYSYDFTNIPLGEQEDLFSCSSSTTYYYQLKVTNCFGTFSTFVQQFTTPSSGTLPTVTTTIATDITSSTATVGGEVTNDGGNTITSRGVYYSTNTVPISGITIGSGTGTFSNGITSLAPNTTYYYRAYATNEIGTNYGNTLSFTTSVLSGVPTVSTLEATNITESGAIAGGNISYNWNSGITEAGICWSTGTTPTIANNKATTGTTQGGYYVMLSPLIDATVYYYRAYAINDIGVGYGEIMSLTTLMKLNHQDRLV